MNDIAPRPGIPLTDFPYYARNHRTWGEDMGFSISNISGCGRVAHVFPGYVE